MNYVLIAFCVWVVYALYKLDKRDDELERETEKNDEALWKNHSSLLDDNGTLEARIQILEDKELK